MRITTKGRYALRAVLQLSQQAENRPVSIRTLSEIEDISAEFLEQIFFRLRKAGLIKSTRGPGGGFQLVKPLDQITIADIFNAVGEELHFSPCTLDDGNSCGREDICSAHGFWEHTYALFRKYFEHVTLDDVLNSRYPMHIFSEEAKINK